MKSREAERQVQRRARAPTVVRTKGGASKPLTVRLACVEHGERWCATVTVHSGDEQVVRARAEGADPGCSSAASTVVAARGGSVSAPINIAPTGEVMLAAPWAPTPATETRVITPRKGKRGDARVYFRADAQKRTARPEGRISIEGSGAHIANNHNARLMRDVPLFVVSGLVETMTPQEGARIAEETRERVEHSFEERRAREEAAFAAAVAELEAVDPDAAVVLAVWARWKLPALIGALALKKAARRLRAGRSVPQLTNARYWLPTSDVVIDGQHVEGLRYWTGDVEVFGSTHDAAAREACRAAYATAVEFTQRCATIFDDPLTPCWIDLPARPAKKCDAGHPAMRIRVQTIAERHPRVMRQLRERSPLPRAA